MSFDLAKYNKFWVALAAAIGQLVIVAAPTEAQAAFVVTTAELYTVLVAVAGALGVYQVANKRVSSNS